MLSILVMRIIKQNKLVSISISFRKLVELFALIIMIFSAHIQHPLVLVLDIP